MQGRVIRPTRFYGCYLARMIFENLVGLSMHIYGSEFTNWNAICYTTHMDTPTQTCEICKGLMEEELADYTLDIDGEQILIEDVPTWVCTQCDHSYVEEEVIEAVEDLLDHLDDVATDED